LAVHFNQSDFAVPPDKTFGTVVDGEDANYTQHFTSGESSLANRRRHEVLSDEFLAVLGEGKKIFFFALRTQLGLSA